MQSLLPFPLPSLFPSLLGVASHFDFVTVAFTRIPPEDDEGETQGGRTERTGEVEEGNSKLIGEAPPITTRGRGILPILFCIRRHLTIIRLIAAITVLFFIMTWTISSLVQHKGGGVDGPLPHTPSLFSVFSAPFASSPAPPAMSQSSAYVRCDLLPNGPLPDLHAQGACTQYLQGSPDLGDAYWREEETWYVTQQQDVAYFTVHHLQQQVGGGQSSDGGRVVVLHENCAPHALSDSWQDESRPHRESRFIDQRWGPTWLEMRMTGPELEASAMRLVTPRAYQPYHRELLRQGSQRRQVLGKAWQHETLQQRYDEAAYLFGNRSDPAFTTAYTTPSAPSAYTHSTSALQDNSPSPISTVRRKERVHGTATCVYEAMYSATLPGRYNLSVWLHNVDFEHAFNLGTRGAWRRVQFAPLWSTLVSLSASSDAAVWTRKTAFSSYSATAAHSGVAAAVDDRTGQVSWQYTPIQEARVSVYGEAELLLVPVAEGLTVPFLPHTRHYGRWVHVNATTQSHGSLTRPLSWNRTTALSRYTQPQLGLCRIANVTNYAFVPYHVEQQHSMAPPALTQSASLLPSPSSSLSSRSTRFPTSTGSEPFSFAHASSCLSGRRLALIGDSHSRMLIGRFVSVLVGSDFRFKKQKFSRRGGEPRSQVEWQCVTLRVDLARNGSTANYIGTEDVSMARDLPIQEVVESNVTAALEEGQFELCHFPSAWLEPIELTPAFFDDGRTFDLVVLDTAQHPLSNGITIADFGEMVLTRIGQIEAALTSELLALDAAIPTNDTTSSPVPLPHPTQNGAQLLTTALWNATSALWNISDEAAAAAPFTHLSNATALTDAVEELSRFPSPGLAELRRRSLWWSSQTFPRRNDWTELPEKRTEVRLQMTREIVRAVTALLGLDYADVVEPVSLPFQDCAADRAHLDWPQVDEAFVQFYDALQQKLHCSSSSSPPQPSLSSDSE